MNFQSQMKLSQNTLPQIRILPLSSEDLLLNIVKQTSQLKRRRVTAGVEVITKKEILERLTKDIVKIRIRSNRK